MRIRVACSPDADDLFMMRALMEGHLDTGRYEFVVEAAPTDALNVLASGDGPEVCAISIAHYPRVAEHYALLPHGGSMGEGYGPVVVAREAMALGELAGRRVAVPGLTTTAFAVLRMMVAIEPVVTPITPYARIFEALRSGEVDAGLIIHEGRLTYQDEGFVRVAELGEWWSEQTGGLPLPLGGNAIRRDLGRQVMAEVSALLKSSIAHALDHRDEAIRWLLDKSALGTEAELDRYLGMYANARTLDYGPDGREAVSAFLARAAEIGILPTAELDWAP